MWALPDPVRELAARPAATILIDGRSGSGKSELATHIQKCWGSTVLVRLDDIYPGWDGLAWTVDHVHTDLLEPRAAGRTGRFRRWDWTTGAPAGWATVDPDRRLIVEGVGTLTEANRVLADLAIWVQTPDAVRKQRALARDGDTYRPHWDRWAAQEDVFIAEHAPQSVADYVLHQSPGGMVWTKVEHLR